MPITNQQSDDAYRAAARALKRVMADPKATEAQAAAAQAAFDRLNDDYIGWSTENIAQRTAAFAQFITAMTRVLARMKREPLLSGVKKLREIVDEAKEALAEADR